VGKRARDEQTARQAAPHGKVPAVMATRKKPEHRLTAGRRRKGRFAVASASWTLKRAAKKKGLDRDVQWDHLGKELLHVDFTRVAAMTSSCRAISLRGTARRDPGGCSISRSRVVGRVLAISIPIDPREHRRIANRSAIKSASWCCGGRQAMNRCRMHRVHVTPPLAEAEAGAPEARAREPESRPEGEGAEGGTSRKQKGAQT